MKKIYYSLLVLGALFIIHSCSDSSTPTETTTVYQLAVTANPTEGGSVSPASGDYDSGNQVQVTATANDGWLFKSWQGDHSGSDNPANITMNSDKSITALFTIRQYPLTVEIQGEGTVSETIVQPKTTNYNQGELVELNAVPADGWVFDRWEGDLTGSDNPAQITINTEKNVTAVFERIEYSITTSVVGEGLVSITPEREFYYFGDEIHINVAPETGWKFVYWDTGELESTENPITTTLTSDLSVTVYLDDSPFAGGIGTDSYPYQVSDVYQLQSIKDYTDKHFVQINDIDASDTQTWNGGLGFEPIGDELINFSGVYNGNTYKIVNLYIDRNTVYVGLFGKIEAAQIINVSLIDFTISNTGRWVGGLVGYMNLSSIQNSSTSGEVVGNDYEVGGLVGANYGGNIKNSFSETNVNGGYRVGGLVGLSSSNSTVVNSYSSGDVNGIEEIGGLVGVNVNGGEISYSYSNGVISGNNDVGGFVGVNGASIVSSYWDTQSTSQSDGVGRGTSEGTKGLNTAQMTGSTAETNMPEFDWNNIWITTSGYPILRWQNN